MALLVFSTSSGMSPVITSDSLLTLARYFLAVSLVRPHLSATSSTSLTPDLKSCLTHSMPVTVGTPLGGTLTGAISVTRRNRQGIDEIPLWIRAGAGGTAPWNI